MVNPTCFKIRIKYSKTDLFLMGCDIYVGHDSGSICPVVAIGNFLALHGAAPGPLFYCADGRPLSWQQLYSSVQSISAGYPGSYSGGSFGIGTATTAAAR